jgi:hypothetical protein
LAFLAVAVQTPSEQVTLTVALPEIASAAQAGTPDKASAIAAGVKNLIAIGSLQNMPLR